MFDITQPFSDDIMRARLDDLCTGELRTKPLGGHYNTSPEWLAVVQWARRQIDQAEEKVGSN